MAETYVTLSSLKHYDEKIKEVIDEKQDQLVGTEGQVVSFDADGNVISKNLEIGENTLVVDFRYKHISDDEGYEAYDFTHTNAEIIDAINNGRTVIIKGLINTARDYAPYIFQLHTYMKNSGRYEFVYSTFNNYMEITEYKLVVYNNDNLEFLVNTYKVNQTIPEIPYGDEGQFISFDEEGNLIAVDAPNGGEEPTLVSFVYEAIANNTWTVHSVDKTYTEIKTALSENKRVIAKGTNKNARLDNPWYFYPNEYYDSAGNWVVFERVNVNGSVIEAFKFAVNGDGTATLVETEVSQIDLSNYVEKEEGKGLSTNDLTDELLAIINSDHTYAKFTDTTETNVNNITKNGKYLIDNSSGNKTGCPSGITRFELYVINVTRYTIQLAFGVYAATTSTTVVPTPTIWVRSKDTMTYSWSTWSKPSASYADNAGKVNNHTVESDVPSDAVFTDTKYTHPTTSGNKHIPSGGSSGQILRWSADGTAVWGADNNTTYGIVSTTADGLAPKRDGSTTKYLRADGTWATPPDNNTTYSNMTAATSSAAGKAGLVPAPAAGAQAKFLRGDGTWQTPTNTTYSNFVKSGSGAKAGLVPAPSTTAGTTKYLREDGGWYVPNPTSHAYYNTSYGAGTSNAYGHVKVSDDLETAPSASTKSDKSIAASLYCAQSINARVVDLEAEIKGYTLVGTVNFTITMTSNSVSTSCTVTNEGGTLPFTKGGGGSSTTAYFKPSQSVTYSCKFKRAHSYYEPTLRYASSVPSATSTTATGTSFLSSSSMVVPTGELADIDYEDVTFSTSYYYFAHHASVSGVSYNNRGGKLYCYSKG